jgi:hypothetical protein
VHVFNSLSQL